MNSHFGKVLNIFVDALEDKRKLAFSKEWKSGFAAAELTGGDCENATRNLGKRAVRAAPLREIRNGLWAWIGYREEWTRDDTGKNRDEFTFHSASVTIYVGFKSSLVKPRVFRAEWTGWTKWDGKEYGYSPEGAGHPHWHFDAMESFHLHETRQLGITRREDAHGGTTVDFDDDIYTRAAAEAWEALVPLGISRIHFPTSANWWGGSPNSGHRHSPGRTEDLLAWLSELVSYLSSELNRL